MRCHHARKEGAQSGKKRNGRKKALGMLICMSGSLSTEDSGRQKEAGRYGAWWAIRVSHSTALWEPHRQRPCVRKWVLCCDRCTLQGPLGSYRTGFTYSEPITPFAFIWKNWWEKKYANLPEFSKTDMLCALFSLLSQSRHQLYSGPICSAQSENNSTTWIFTTPITFLSSLWFDFLSS